MTAHHKMKRTPALLCCCLGVLLVLLTSGSFLPVSSQSDGSVSPSGRRVGRSWDQTCDIVVQRSLLTCVTPCAKMAGKWWNLATAIILSSLVGVGETAAEAPFIVSNKHGGRKICHGTVVDNQHILLPAFCLEYINPKTLPVVYADVGVGETAAEAPFLVSILHGGWKICHGSDQHIELHALWLEYINPKTLPVVYADVGVGETAAEAPFIVSIRHGGRKICHGTVVDNQHISLHPLFLEGINPKTLTVMYANGETRGVINFRVHPNWDPSTLANGEAMLKVDRPITFSEDIQPAHFAYDGEVIPPGKGIAYSYRDVHSRGIVEGPAILVPED